MAGVTWQTSLFLFLVTLVASFSQLLFVCLSGIGARAVSEDTFLKIADLAVSLAILVALLLAFIRGELISRRSISAIVSHTVKEVLDQLSR